MRAEPLDAPLTADDLTLVSWAAVPADGLQSYLQKKSNKALAIGRNGFWVAAEYGTRPEAARLAVERCSDNLQTPCVLLSVDAMLPTPLPRGYELLRPFTLAGEKDMTDADKQRIAEIYSAKDWRALVKGSAGAWYAIGHAESEDKAVDQA